jgi:hypothetical protein
MCAFGKFSPARYDLIPDIETLGFGKISVGDRQKESLQELPASWQLQRFEGVEKQLQKGILTRQTTASRLLDQRSHRSRRNSKRSHGKLNMPISSFGNGK